jgi:type II secretory pathway pseudopilin PulG
MNKEDGFTIIELLIASIAFTVLLILVTMIVIQVSRVYYKGVILSNTQNVDSVVMQDVSKDIQFGSNTPNMPVSLPETFGNFTVYCVGNNIFIYNLGQEFTQISSSNIGLIYGSSTTCPTNGPNPSTLINKDIQNGEFQELLSPMMRVVNFSITPKSLTNLNGSLLYDINIGIAFGSNQALCNSSVVNTCTNQDTMSIKNNYSNYSGKYVQCKLQLGDQYCGVSYLNTTVANEYNLN